MRTQAINTSNSINNNNNNNKAASLQIICRIYKIYLIIAIFNPFIFPYKKLSKYKMNVNTCKKIASVKKVRAIKKINLILIIIKNVV